ncbi:MAG TPA: hypothetical protein VKG38_08370 [Solirubrobacteraceae bacterium]|nr:hypothetical protein [Solirubrobacteraceae bacterium]
MLPSIVRLLRLASFLICAIVIASFVIFAINQTGSASKGQQEAVLTTTRATSNSATVAAATAPHHEGAVRKLIDEAASSLTSPFSALTSGSSSEWAIRGAKLLLALVVYGFGLGYLARVLRVRV